MVRQIARPGGLFQICHILARCSEILPHLETSSVKWLRRAAPARQLCLYVCLSPETPGWLSGTSEQLPESRLRQFETAVQLFLSCLSQPAPFQVPVKLTARPKRLLRLRPRCFHRLSVEEPSSNPVF